MREALPDVSVLKLGLTWPLPEKLIAPSPEGVKRLLVVEELEPFLEEQVKAMGLAVSGKEYIPSTGRLVRVLAGKMIEAGLLEQQGGPAAGTVRRMPRLFQEDRR